MDGVFGFDDPEFSDRTLRVVEPGDRPAKRTRRTNYCSAGGRLVHVNKLILSSQSKYFRNLLGKKFAESKSKEVEICVGEGETDAFVVLIHSFYFRVIPNENTKFSFEASSLEELIKIIRLTDMFDAPVIVLQDVYKEISKRKLSLEVCEALLDLPDHITSSDHFKSLQNESISNFILHDFYDCYKFDKYSAKLLEILLEHDELVVGSEDSIWPLFVHWLFYRKECKCENVPAKTVDLLLKCIRFEHIRKYYMIQIVALWPCWFENLQRRELLVAALCKNDENDKRLLSALGIECSRKNRSFLYLSVDCPASDGTRIFYSVFGLPLVFQTEKDKNSKSVYLVISLDFADPCMVYLNPKSNIRVLLEIHKIVIDKKSMAGVSGVYGSSC
eukprot:367283_1